MALSDEMTELLQRELQSSGVGAALQTLADRLREEQKYHELFEVLKMQQRHRFNLPLVPFPEDPPVPAEQRDALDDALIEVCREVGTLLLREGKVQEGWMYFRPVSDVQAAAELLQAIPVTDENADALIQVLISEGVDPGRGFALLLERYGTCNAITTFESEMPRATPAAQRAAARCLLEHLTQELVENIRHDLTRRGQSVAAEISLMELVDQHPEIFENHAYHIDATHLASVVRFAKLLEDHAALQSAVALCHYGESLSEQYQFEGDEPFRKVYPDHRRFFEALLGQSVDEAIDYFRGKADEIDPHTQGTMAAEVLIDLLTRLGRHQEALDESLRRLAGRQTVGIAPSLVELCRRGKDYHRLLQYCREQDDLLGFSTALLLAHEDGAKK